MKNIFKTIKTGLFLAFAFCVLQSTSFAMQPKTFTIQQMLDALLDEFAQDSSGKTVQQVKKSEILGILGEKLIAPSAALTVAPTNESAPTAAGIAAIRVLDSLAASLNDPRHSLPLPPTILEESAKAPVSNAELYDGSDERDEDAQIAQKRRAVQKWHKYAEARAKARKKTMDAQLAERKRATETASIRSTASHRPLDGSKLTLLKRKKNKPADRKSAREFENSKYDEADIFNPSATAASALSASFPAPTRELSAFDLYIPQQTPTDEEIARAMQSEWNREDNNGTAVRHTAPQRSVPKTAAHHSARPYKSAHNSHNASARATAPANHRLPSNSGAAVAKSQTTIPKPTVVRPATALVRPATASAANVRIAKTASSTHSSVQNPTARMISDLEKCIPVLIHHMCGDVDEKPYTSILKPAITQHMSSIRSLGELTDATEMLEAIKKHAHKLAFKDLKAVYEAVDKAMILYNQQTEA